MTTPPADTRIFLLASAAAVLLVAVPWTWRNVATHVITVMHEFGHTVMTVLMGGTPTGVKLHRDSSGVTNWRAPRRQMRLRLSVVAWWGVPAPGVIGASCVWAAANERTSWAMLGLAAMTMIVTLLIRNLWGLLVVAVSGWLGWLAWNAGGTVPLAATVGIGVLATVGGVRGGFEEMQVRHDPSSDASRLQQLLWLRSGFWSATMLTAALGAAGVAAWQIVEVAR